MKVLQVINTLGTGGAEKLLLEALPQYRSKGHRVDLLLLNGTEYPFLEALRKKDCCTIHTLGNGSVYNPLHILRLIPFFRSYDIVHVHLFPGLYWAAFAKLLGFWGCKLVYTEHCTTNWRMQKGITKYIDRFVYRAYDKLVCISEEVRESIQSNIGLKPDKFQVIENGVDLSRITGETPYQKHELGLPIGDNDILVLQVSRFQQQKDQPTVIRALSLLPQHVHLLLVGEGELLEDNKKLARELGLSARVHFFGVRMDIPKLLKTADIVVLSSHYEGLSLSSIEGLGSGRPFLASEVPGLTEIVSGAGILFPLQDAEALADEIRKLISHKAHYASVAQQCMERAKRYDIGFMIDKHIILYQQLISGPNAEKRN